MPKVKNTQPSRARMVAATVEVGDERAADNLLAAGMTLFRTDIDVQMDPRLQRVIARREMGVRQEASASAEVDEIPVIAKVTDVAAWEGLSEVRVGMTIGRAEDEDATIVTGRIPTRRIEAVRQFGFVRSLKAAQKLTPALAAGVGETGAAPSALPAGSLSNGGAGVVVGIVDYGCDFAHRNFVTASGSTRLISIWEQQRTNLPDPSVPYGREHNRAEIDAALKQADPYVALGYGPDFDTASSVGTHGTHVMDIAAGNGNGSGVAGFAPNADLIFVDVAHDDIDFSGPKVASNSFGNSVQLLEAITYIFRKAGDRPCVVNISLGTNGGPHDGSTLVEKGIDSLIAAQSNRAVTIAASNSFDDGIHASGAVPAGGVHELVWRVPFGDITHNEFELWYSAGDQISLEIITPDGRSLGLIRPGANGTITGPGGQIEIFAANRVADPNNGDNVIGVFLERSAAAGDWKLRLHGDVITSGQFHAWIERDDASPSAFAPPLDNTHTVGSISCGKLSLVVGSYDAHKPGRPISWFSSAGPTRDGREKPEISAPGHDVAAAHSRTKTGVVKKSGTSMASPGVAGIVALMLGEARSRGASLSAADIRDIVIGSARRGPPAGAAWNDRYGAGRIGATAAVNAVIARTGGAPATVAGAAASKPKKKTRKAAGKVVAGGAPRARKTRRKPT